MEVHKQWATAKVLELMNKLGFSNEQVLRAIEKYREEKEVKKMSNYTVNCWIPVEVEEPELYSTYQDAVEVMIHLGDLHPENMYEVGEVKEKEISHENTLKS